MKVYDVWLEGFRVQEGHQPAKFLGNYKAETFREACVIAMRDNNYDIDTYYDTESNTFWGCRFFNNEQDARKSFG